MDKAQKKEAVSDYNQVFANSQSVIVTHYSGLTVSQLTDLRSRLIKAGADFQVTKNKLAKIAVKGTPCESIESLFTGPTGVAYSSDAVAAAKAAFEFSKTNDKFVIVGGSLNGKTLDKSSVEALAKLPSLDELRARLVGMIQTPATRLVTISQAPAAQLARVLGAYSRKG